jgi:hypothetical protein
MTVTAESLLGPGLLIAILIAGIYGWARWRPGAKLEGQEEATAPLQAAANAPALQATDAAVTMAATTTVGDPAQSPKSRQEVVTAATQLLQTRAAEAEFVVIHSVNDIRRYVQLIPTGPKTCDAQLSGQFSGPEQEGLRRWQFAALPEAGLFRRPGVPLSGDRILDVLQGVFADVYGLPDDPLRARCCDPELNQLLP